MNQDETKMVLGAKDATSADAVMAHGKAVEELLKGEVPKANLVGVGLGVKWYGIPDSAGSRLPVSRRN